MSRLGKITALDFDKCIGEITDENDQDISFDLLILDAEIQLGEFVVFDIFMAEDGLMAVDISRAPQGSISV